MHPVRRQISPFAGSLRRNATEVEKRLWSRLRDRQLDGRKFRRQATIGSYVADFLCVEARLVVELDGGQHGEERDARRTAWLRDEGYEVLRFWNTDVLENIDGVLSVISSAVKKKTLTQPSPAKAGEG